MGPRWGWASNGAGQEQKQHNRWKEGISLAMESYPHATGPSSSFADILFVTMPSQNMLEFNLASEKVILFSARAHQVKTLVDDFILELKKVRIFSQVFPPPRLRASNRALPPHIYTSLTFLGSMTVSIDFCLPSVLCTSCAFHLEYPCPLLPAPSENLYQCPLPGGTAPPLSSAAIILLTLLPWLHGPPTASQSLSIPSAYS